ncbi:TRZ/ATZ family protein, partial [Coprococcus eutactus]|nr:TRZ/ATZ family protein [Coprococcus eutactus]
MDKHIKAPFDTDVVKKLKAVDYVYIDGILYSARDAAHKRMYDSILESGCYDASGTALYEKGIVPIDLNG